MIKKIVENILYPIKKIHWRIKNKTNYTTMGNNFSTSKVKVGCGTYGTLNIYSFNNKKEFLEIGRYCSIAPNVVFLLGGEHNYKYVSTYPFKHFINNIQEAETKGKINISDDVWIGFGATILSGVSIGQGAIIGAGTIVAENVPEYAIYAGGKIIKYRFSSDIIKKIRKIDYGNLEHKTDIRKNISLLYEEIDENNIDYILKKIK